MADNKQAAVVSLDMTLFIRLLEVAREEIKNDTDLHQMVERCSEQQVTKGQPLTMDDYNVLVPQKAESTVLSSVLARLNQD
jgi:hypothetical protein